MGVYAYCVVPQSHKPPPTLAGLNGATVADLVVHDLAVWISRGERPEVAVEAIKLHNQVVEAAVTQQVTPVPLRFGQWFVDDAALSAALADKAAAYREALAQFAGCLEFGLRLIDPREEGGAQDVRGAGVASGYEYMQALRESSRLAGHQQERAAQVRDRVRASVAGVVRAEREDDARRTPHAVVTLSHLVARQDFDEYRERARALRGVFPDLRLLLSGPWPPYSFSV
jgi:hypothetical protein